MIYSFAGYSTGFARAYYSFDQTMQFALDGINAYKSWKHYLRSADAQATFTETGALWMMGCDRPTNERMITRLRRFGVAAEHIDEAELKKQVPLLFVCNVLRWQQPCQFVCVPAHAIKAPHHHHHHYHHVPYSVSAHLTGAIAPIQ